MNILFISPKFYNYENIIENTLRNMDFNVSTISYCEKSFHKKSFFYNLLILILRLFLKPISMPLFYKSLVYLQTNSCKKVNEHIASNNLVNEEYDILFIIKGYGLNKNLINNISSKFKVLYQWDSLCFYPGLSDSYSCYDKVYTFDKQDYEHGFGEYLPNFYQKDNITNLKITENHLFFVGKYTPERYDILCEVSKHCELINLPFHIRLIYSGYFKLFRKSKIISFEPVSNNYYKKLFSSSKFIVELSSPKQSGYTQRFYEAVGNNKLVISENENPYSISIKDFLKMDMAKLDDFDISIPSYIFDLEINNWLKIIIFGKSLNDN